MKKKLFWVIAIILGLLCYDHYNWHWVSGGVDVAVTDSSIVVTPSTVVVDTIKADSLKK